MFFIIINLMRHGYTQKIFLFLRNVSSALALISVKRLSGAHLIAGNGKERFCVTCNIRITYSTAKMKIQCI